LFQSEFLIKYKYEFLVSLKHAVYPVPVNPLYLTAPIKTDARWNVPCFSLACVIVAVVSCMSKCSKLILLKHNRHLSSANLGNTDISTFSHQRIGWYYVFQYRACIYKEERIHFELNYVKILIRTILHEIVISLILIISDSSSLQNYKILAEILRDTSGNMDGRTLHQNIKQSACPHRD
jgi:hypothetical protein